MPVEPDPFKVPLKCQTHSCSKSITMCYYRFWTKSGVNYKEVCLDCGRKTLELHKKKKTQRRGMWEFVDRSTNVSLRACKKSHYQRLDLSYWCPGCEHRHQVPIKQSTLNTDNLEKFWDFNRLITKPTLIPSMVFDQDGDKTCYHKIKDGMIHYHDSCKHRLAGQTVSINFWTNKSENKIVIPEDFSYCEKCNRTVGVVNGRCSTCHKWIGHKTRQGVLYE